MLCICSLLVFAGGLAVSAVEASAQASAVDFSYAFATPHRMAVALPDSSDKTLLDAEPGNLRMAWTYGTLLNAPLMAYDPLTAPWSVRLHPQIAEQPPAASAWKRVEQILPALENAYTDPKGAIRLEVVGGATAALVRITMTNTSDDANTFRLLCKSERGFYGYNPAYVDPGRDRDCLLAGWGDRADRVLVLAIGSDDCAILDATTLCPTWHVPAGQTRTGWLVRPYRGYAADLPALRGADWAKEAEAAKQEWRTLLGQAVRVQIPDPGVVDALYACLGDLFIMREPVARGYIAATPGTEGYRAPNSGEAAIVSVALDQFGLHNQAIKGYQMCLDQQGTDGDWADPQGWCHLMWCISGFKSWAAMEHYLLSGDRAFLESIYPRMLASSRHKEQQRARTRLLVDGQRPLTYGLMPRGMGDCGLKDGDDLYGVFLPHNIWAVYADRVTLEAAEILGKTDDLSEVKSIYETALGDLLQAMDKGAISESGFRWIPGVPGKTSGSRWGALNALFPCRLVPPDHELVSGTIGRIESAMSPGGLPLNTGWLPDGMWVAIALDNLAAAHLVRNEGDAAAALLYATLNHATPLYTWCEERGQEPGSTTVTGDRQHLWTPVAVVRAIRDFMVLEDGAELHLARGLHRDWLKSGAPVGITDAPTHFGHITYSMQYDAAASRVMGKAVFPQNAGLKAATLHVRLPEGRRVVSANPESKAMVLPDGSGVRWDAPAGEMRLALTIQ
ncbi:MAG TPA: hypothetical protein PLM14_03265 [Candidatus Hydrogenedentes bacterium]|nr:hypothetical protein [Candidatus Hydrogenedentota bacterium]HQE81992.1 hypothetical protein [Candidatus Hydrogenedentota bacterium]HQM49229.1 hypothetical protein [Candidatus Hydrogenedentota bacterium]